MFLYKYLFHELQVKYQKARVITIKQIVLFIYMYTVQKPFV